MTKATKKKHVFHEILCSEDDSRLPSENESIVKVICGKGNNLFEVQDLKADGESFLVTMPCKFRKTVWVKRGDFLLVTDIPDSGGGKVKGEISEILTRKRINGLKKMGVWPVIDDNEEKIKAEDDEGISDDDDDEEFVNINRRPAPDGASDSSTDDD